MNTETLMKYVIWMTFFALALAGIYAMLKKFGII